METVADVGRGIQSLPGDTANLAGLLNKVEQQDRELRDAADRYLAATEQHRVLATQLASAAGQLPVPALESRWAPPRTYEELQAAWPIHAPEPAEGGQADAAGGPDDADNTSGGVS